MSPARAWYDAATGKARPFGTEWDWPDAPVVPELMEDIRDKIVAHSMRHDYGLRLSPSRLTSTPRQVLIEKFVDTMIDPDDAASKHLGVLIHEGIEKRYVDRGYHTESMLSGSLTFGGTSYPVVGIPDAHWALTNQDDAPLPRTSSDAHVIDVKTTSSGAMRFILEAGMPREDHVAQVSIYAHLYSQTYLIPVEEVICNIRYFCIPQKERMSIGGYVRMPPTKQFRFNAMTMAEIGEHIPGYSVPTRATHYQGPPPDSIEKNAATVTAAFARISAGEAIEVVLNEVGCMCDRRFNGSGREYCDVMRDCAMMIHGVPYF